jgi:hypothetical protein
LLQWVLANCGLGRERLRLCLVSGTPGAGRALRERREGVGGGVVWARAAPPQLTDWPVHVLGGGPPITDSC